MNQLRLDYPVQALSQTLEMPPSTFYARQSLPESLLLTVGISGLTRFVKNIGALNQLLNGRTA